MQTAQRVGYAQRRGFPTPKCRQPTFPKKRPPMLAAIPSPTHRSGLTLEPRARPWTAWASATLLPRDRSL